MFKQSRGVKKRGIVEGGRGDGDIFLAYPYGIF
jgi:hypothetical protein